MGESLEKLKSLTGRLNNRDMKLKKMSSKLNLALNLCKIGVWDLDVEKNILEWDERMISIFGCNAYTYQEFLDCVHSDDRDKVLQAVTKSIRDCSTFDIKYKIVTSVGIVKKIHARGEMSDTGRGTKRFIGVCVVLKES